ncbi:hypothetical protein TUMSATVNIG1_18720 [Vibrio nigripulchritudo]|uniref:hypothetical protein n=1 Tax=Vibrio nigripulchritudo TaxID=28173 RepID=UPI00190C4941|nr:hypothetical protein [Vibrio nigripulchritudo]BCL69916.1 hypothetical protein VNTUMSATTG_18530 [Vibrio nigripulchritudo]BDU31263.1 hypothetical protein TUMSATVNIG1_18720 [Vibrio nigripulchritudo]
MKFKITEIFSVDVCRDGGSYSLSFRDNDGEWYEFFVQVKGVESSEYHEPKLYKNGVNSGVVVEEYTWKSASQFLSKIKCQEERFPEIVQLVGGSGILT